MIRLDSGKGGLNLLIVCVIAWNRDTFSRELRLCDRSTGHVHGRSGLTECLRNPLAHSSATAGHQRDPSSEHPQLSHLDLFARLLQVPTDVGNTRRRTFADVSRHDTDSRSRSASRSIRDRRTRTIGKRR